MTARPCGPAPRRSVAAIAALSAGLAAFAPAAAAFTATLNPGTRAIYLRVGDGIYTGTYTGNGTPGNGGGIDVVSVTVPAAALGNGTDQVMTTTASSGVSNYDGYAFCNVPAQIYVGGFYRRSGAGGAASLTATVPAGLTNAQGESIAFSQISWTSSGNGDTGAQPIPAGTFQPGTQLLTSFPINTWRESCHTFRYANDAVVGAGTYTGRVTYTLSAP
ncbi:hypothetical protein J5226_04845 [Lysobacter sp. K5869]|uniref:hypothetical protein n=1 Tax=Lysobacter sp. K5869 TaxID=2820808 RepID=UPI001C0605EA|nr:hypothetical protein [Lysobacter sp. K5869]QWP77746.1 hypothetical protein J5226_04845 [Lysobacter sp. K5869]